MESRSESGSSTEAELDPGWTQAADTSEATSLREIPANVINVSSNPIGSGLKEGEFCAREDVLEQLAQELLPLDDEADRANARLRHFALCGLGGIGKTETAVEFCRRHSEHFDLIFWIVADNLAKLNEQCQQIADYLGLGNSSHCSDSVIAGETLRQWLEHPVKPSGNSHALFSSIQEGAMARWLIVLDGAGVIWCEDWPGGPGSLLITSRNPMYKSEFNPVRNPWVRERYGTKLDPMSEDQYGIELEPLSEVQSLSLLRSLITTSERDAEVCMSIARALGGIPLAISQISALIREKSWSLREVGLAVDEPHLFASLFQSTPDIGTYPHSIATAWCIDSPSEIPKELIQLTFFFHGEKIREELLTNVFLGHGMNGRARSWIRYEIGRNELLWSSLIQRDKGQKTISVNPLVQDVMFSYPGSHSKSGQFHLVLRALWEDWPAALPKPPGGEVGSCAGDPLRTRKPPEERRLPGPKSFGQRLNLNRRQECASIYPHIKRLHRILGAMPQLPADTGILFARVLIEASW